MKITLKAARVNSNYTQLKAAEKMGVSVDTIRNWETGKTYPSVEQAKLIADLYNINLDSIIFLKNNYA